MHAGLLRPDSVEAQGGREARVAADAIAKLGPQESRKAPVALVFSYEAVWVCGIQPQGQSFRYLELVYEWYSALRRQGLDIDIVSPDSDLSGYGAVFIPTMPIVSDGFIERLEALDCPVLIGPRSGSKTGSFCIPDGLAPGKLRSLIPLTVSRVESLRPGEVAKGDGWTVSRWLEEIDSDLSPEFSLENGRGVVYSSRNTRYCAAWPDRSLLDILVAKVAQDAGIDLTPLPEGLRLRRTASHIFAFNYAAQPVDSPSLGFAKPLLGESVIAPAGFAVWAQS